MLGAFRGLAASAKKWMCKSGASEYCGGKWWRIQLNGLIGWSAAFMGPSKKLLENLKS